MRVKSAGFGVSYPALSENSNEAQHTGIAVVASLPHGAIADKMLVVRAGRKDDYAMNPVPFFLRCFAGWINRHQQVVIEYLEVEIRVLKSDWENTLDSMMTSAADWP